MKSLGKNLSGPRAITNGSFVNAAPPRASGAGAARRVNLLILLKPPQTAAWRPNFGRRPHMAAISPPAALFCVALHIGRTSGLLKRTTSQASHARCRASSGRPMPTVRGSSARRRLLTTRRPRQSRATSGVHRWLPPTHRTMPAICRRRFSTTPTRRKRNQWKQPVDQGEQPAPKVEEEEAAAAKPRSGAGTASSSASKFWRKGEDKCPGTIGSSAVQRGI